MAAPTLTDPGNQTNITDTVLPSPLVLTGADTDGDPMLFTNDKDLPPGLSFNTTATTAEFSGTPTTAGYYDIEVTVTAGGESAITQFYWYINIIPVVDAIADQSAVKGTPITPWFVTATDQDVTNGDQNLAYEVQKLPKGLVCNPSTGEVTGTPTSTGVFTCKVRVNDGIATSTVLTQFMYTVTGANTPPVITKPPNQVSQVNDPIPGNQFVIGSDSDIFDSLNLQVTNLPPGVTANISSPSTLVNWELFNGVPTGVGTTTIAWDYGVVNGAPLTITMTWESFFLYGASNPAQPWGGNFVQTTLPQLQLPIKSTGGERAYLVKIQFSQPLDGGFQWNIFDLDVTNEDLIFISDDGSYDTAGHNQLSVVTWAGLQKASEVWWVWKSTARSVGGQGPKGSSTVTTGSIVATFTGTPTSTGNFTANISLDDGTETVLDSFSWDVVTSGSPPTITVPPNQTDTVNVAIVDYQMVATDPDTGDTLTFTDPGNSLPSGLSISSSGLITGTPDTVGNNTVTILVTDSTSNQDSAQFDWDIVTAGNTPPQFTGDPTARLDQVGESLAQTFTVVDPDVPATQTLTFMQANLPDGAIFNMTSGEVSGSAAFHGTYPTVISVEDGAGGSDAANINWMVLPFELPNLINILGESITYDPLYGAIGLNWSATNLPDGLSINTATGRITGETTQIGTFSPTVSVNDGTSFYNLPFVWLISDFISGAFPQKDQQEVEMSSNNRIAKPGTTVHVPFEIIQPGTGAYVDADAIPTVLEVTVDNVAVTNVPTTVTQKQDQTPANIVGHYNVEVDGTNLVDNNEVAVLIRAVVGGVTKGITKTISVYDVTTAGPQIV